MRNEQLLKNYGLESLNERVNNNYSVKVKLEKYLSYYNINSAEDLTYRQINEVLISESNGMRYEEGEKDITSDLTSYFPPRIKGYINNNTDISQLEVRTLWLLETLLQYPFEFPNDNMREIAIEYCSNILQLSKNSYISKELAKLEDRYKIKLSYERVYPNNCIINCGEDCPCNIG